MSAKTKKAVLIIVMWAAIIFSVFAFFGMLIAAADPTGGWAAWRVGLFAGSIGAAGALCLGSIVALVWLAD